MYYTIYYIILGYFILGAVGFYFINRKKPSGIARQNWIKYISYFFIISILFFSIVIQPFVFSYLAVLIITVATYELLNLYVKSGNQNQDIFLPALVVMTVFSIGFYKFSTLNEGIILFTFLILSIFDSFSQITGQLFGNRKIFPGISPNKTLGGLIGGSITALLSAILLKNLYPEPVYKVLTMAIGIITFAFVGDVSTSYYKRKFQVKDFSNLIPGHGGFLDRFDSMIAAGAWVAFNSLINF